jgi:hypothetical protein
LSILLQVIFTFQHTSKVNISDKTFEKVNTKIIKFTRRIFESFSEKTELSFWHRIWKKQFINVSADNLKASSYQF